VGAEELESSFWWKLMKKRTAAQSLPRPGGRTAMGKPGLW
jgi:hypothetical protein